MAKAGFGIIVLPPYALSALPIKSLAGRELFEPDVARVIDVAHRHDRSLSPAAAELCGGFG